MGTNYYIEDNSEQCHACGRGSESIHIGKRSAGWNYKLRVNEVRKLYSPSDVYNFVIKYHLDIFDEYGRWQDPDEWLSMVVNWHEGKWEAIDREFS